MHIGHVNYSLRCFGSLEVPVDAMDMDRANILYPVEIVCPACFRLLDALETISLIPLTYKAVILDYLRSNRV